MFVWADGGDLRKFWYEFENPTCSMSTIEWALGQILGLADALDKWHNHSQINCRHGDLKPENIVRTLHENNLGTLLISDLGLAKIHSLPTRQRRVPSLSGGGTLRYRSPEMKLEGGAKISRSYDMWSFGCVILEFIIWLLYGKEALGRFETDCFKSQNDAFFAVDSSTFSLQSAVNTWVEHIESTYLRRDGPCVSPALRRLFYFVTERLLIRDEEDSDFTQEHHHVIPGGSNTVGISVGLTAAPLNRSSSVHQVRAKSEELHMELQSIAAEQAKSPENYVYNSAFVLTALAA